jgi:regulator of protease activity HflC (stomatin/prohibitin superfamily)
MKNIFALGLFVASLSACSFHQVQPGEVGLKVHLTGSDKGLATEELGPGYYWFGPTEQFYEFPIFEQIYNWTKSPNEGNNADESFTFQTKEGLSVNTDIGINFHLEKGRVSDIFAKYRQDMDYLKHTYMHNVVRNALNKVGSQMPVESVYGQGKSDLVAQVKKMVQEDVGPEGIIVNDIFITGEFRLPETVTAQIQAKITATQTAMKVENEVRQAQAEAKKNVAIADGEAQRNVATANGEATAILAKATAQAKANILLAQSITPSLVEWKRLDIESQKAAKWSGNVPMVSTGSGSGTLLNMTIPAVLGK